MSSDAKSILGTIYKVSLLWIYRGFVLHSRFIYLGVGRMGRGGGGRKSEGSIAGANPEDQEAVDRRQNNKMLRQGPLRHCAASSVPRIYCPHCFAETVTKTMSVVPLLGNN